MSTVRKAVVLAAGLGTRLRPLTCSTPKPLLPVWGEPMLARIVALLRERGVEEIVVNCHYLHEQVETWCAANGCRASYEPEILGTGGVLNPLRGWIGGDEFYLVNGDIVMEGVPELPEPTGEAIVSALVTDGGPRTIEVEPTSGYVTNWKSDEPGYPGTYTYCGLARLKAEILDYVKGEGFSSIVEAYERAMMAGRFVKTVRSNGLLWTDAGTIASYIDLNRDGDDNAFRFLPQLRAVGAETVEFLGARGSDRVFFRADDRAIVIYDDSRRGENARYAAQARWLGAKGVPVPAVLADLAEEKTLALEWAGIERPYALTDAAKVIGALARFNALGADAVAEGLGLEPPFDAALYAWERNLFAEHCLGTRFRRELPVAVAKELEGVAARLLKEPTALVHRDFQSTNVLWKNGALRFIDFQGMRLGPAVYDLASFLYDPYVEIPNRDRTALAKLYAEACGREDIPAVLPFAAVERLVQCLGAYGRLASVGQPQFGKYVLPALERLLSVADQAGLEALGALAEDLIAAESRARAHDQGDGCACGCHAS